MMSATITRESVLSLLPGKLTAWQAFAAVQQAAQHYDQSIRLVWVRSDISIDFQGLAGNWKFDLDLLQMSARAIFEVQWRAPSLDIDAGAIYLREWVSPFLAENDWLEEAIQLQRVPDAIAGTAVGQAVEALLREGTLTRQWPEERWRQHLASRPPLPVPFRDSPEAVRALIDLGADFETGPTDLYLESKVLSNGQAIWWVDSNGEYQTPFAGQP